MVTQNVTKSSITQQLRTDLGRSVGVTTATQLFWFNQFNLPTNHRSRDQKDIYLKSVNNPPYKDRGPTANHSGEVITIITQTSKVIKTVYQIYIKTSVRVRYAPRLRV